MSYLLSTDDTLSFEDFSEAREAAEAITAEQSIEVQVIHVATGAVAFVTTPVPAGQAFTPWTRVETPKHLAPHFEGFVPAYTRKRIGATAYRSITHAGWRIFDGRNGNFLDVANTKEGAGVFTEMRLGRLL